MIKICLYSHSVDFAGTWRSHEKIMQNLDRTVFDPYIMYWDNPDANNRLKVVMEKFGKDRLIPFQRSIDKSGSDTGYTPVLTNFKEIALANKFDIIHFARSGYYEWPFTDRLAKLQIETNIFGFKDTSQYLDRSISIAPVVYESRGGADVLIPNPISIPLNISKDIIYRQKLNIPADAIVLGRVGRADNFDPIALQAFKLLQQESQFSNVYYLIVSPCSHTTSFVKTNNINNVIFIEATNNDKALDLFHRNLDIFCHYRSDGEVHSIALSTAMSYALPCITHRAGYNGQVDTVGVNGFVCTDYNEYYNRLKELVLNKQKRLTLGENSRQYIIDNFEETMIVKRIQDKYLEWLK
jgi:glycosyltransferase involved in cell wall biosynthesis